MYKVFKTLGMIIFFTNLINAKPIINLSFGKESMSVSPKGDRINIASLKEAFSREHPTPRKHKVVITDEAHSPLPDEQVIKGDKILTLLVKFVKEGK